MQVAPEGLQYFLARIHIRIFSVLWLGRALRNPTILLGKQAMMVFWATFVNVGFRSSTQPTIGRLAPPTFSLPQIFKLKSYCGGGLVQKLMAV